MTHNIQHIFVFSTQYGHFLLYFFANVSHDGLPGHGRASLVEQCPLALTPLSSVGVDGRAGVVFA